MHSTNVNNDTSIEARFESHEIVDCGTAQIPNLLLWHYKDLKLTDGQCMLLIHIIARKWTREAPYPSLKGIKMDANPDTRRRYVRNLRRAGLLFTTRLFWTAADKEKFDQAQPGKVRSNLWYLSSLLHNLVRMHKWLEAGNQADTFQVEIPLTTVRMFLEVKFHDTPPEIAQVILEQTKNGTVLRAVLLPCENRIVDLPSMRFSSTRNSSTRKTHSHEEETISKKNQVKEEAIITKVGASAPAAAKRKKRQKPAEEKAPKVKTRIRDIFLQKTNLTMPSRGPDNGFWWSEFGEIANIAGQNVERAEWLVEQVVEYMREKRLTISGPQSIVNLCRSLAAGQPLNGGLCGNNHLERQTPAGRPGYTEEDIRRQDEFLDSIDLTRGGKPRL